MENLTARDVDRYGSGDGTLAISAECDPFLVLLNEADKPEGQNTWYWMWQGIADRGIKLGLFILVSSGAYDYTVKTTEAGRQHYRRHAAPVGEW